MTTHPPQSQSGGAERPSWWRSLPWARTILPTNLCHTCGHCFDRHVLNMGWKWVCKVLHCPCTGRQPFHEAGIPEGLIRDSVTVRGKVVTIDQPKPPGRPING